MKRIMALFISLLILGAASARADITTGLQGWWKFDDGSGTTASDSSGNGNTGTLTGYGTTPTWVAGESGDALSFNGNSWVSIPSSSSINTVATANQITISAWIKVASVNNTFQEIISRDGKWGLLLMQNNEITLTTSWAYSEYSNGFAITADNQWHLVTGTFDGTTIRLYEDGALMTSCAGGAISNNTESLDIGASGGYAFTGSIDDVHIYSRALSVSDIAQLYAKTPVSLITDNTTYPTAPATVLLTATTYPASGVTIQHVEFYSNNNGVVTDLGAGKAGTTANTYTLTWNNAATGIYALTAVVTDSNNTINTSSPVNIYVNSSLLSYSVNSNGLQGLQYNGQQFITTSPYGGIGGVLFQAPNGTQKIYGWVGSGSGSPSPTNNPANSYYTGSACSNILPSNWATVSPGSDPVCNQSIYPGGGTGGTDGYTVSTLYTTSDPKTFKIDYYVTNNDKTDILEEFEDEYFMTLTVPNMTNNWLWEVVGGVQFGSSPVAPIQGTWGSMVLYTDDYTKNAQFGDVWTTSTSTGPEPFLFNFSNYSSPDPVADPSDITNDPILPGQTYHYALYIRFGLPTDNALYLAPQAYTSFAQANPLIVNWPDRRPIARQFIGGDQCVSSTDTRGWCNLDVSSQANFSAGVLAGANSNIVAMNNMVPKPQGIVVWDLEGDEFYQSFTYVGNPPQLSAMAPEMDAAADQMFNAYKAAGYQVGMTLRPSNFQTGSSLPKTCNYNASNTGLSDEFILTTPTTPGSSNITLAQGPSLYGAYVCTGVDASNPTSPWTQPGYRLPGDQTMSNTDSVTLSWLEAKIAYAHNRWDARIYYIDSTVYTDGNSLNFNIFRQLQQAFPDCLFMPENQEPNYYGSTAAYSSIEGYGQTAVPSSATAIWPNAFTVVEAVDDVDVSNDGSPNSYYAPLLSSVESGNALFVDSYTDGGIDPIYQAAYKAQPSSIPSYNTQGYGLTAAVSGAGSGNLTGTIAITTNGTTTNVQEINCPSANCVAAFDGGTAVTLTATPASGSHFAGWSGGCSGTATTCVVTVNKAQTVTATFNIGTAPINYGDVNGDGNVTIVDAELTAQAAVGLITLTSTQLQAAEVDGTGKLDIYDAYLIAEYAIGLINTFPVQ